MAVGGCELGLRVCFPPVKLLNTLTSPFVLLFGSGVWASPEDGGIEARWARGVRLEGIEKLPEKPGRKLGTEKRRWLALSPSFILTECAL
jgi:hypothetical protein